MDPDRAGALEAVKQFSAVTSNGPNLGKNSLDHVATSPVATSPVATSPVGTSQLRIVQLRPVQLRQVQLCLTK